MPIQPLYRHPDLLVVAKPVQQSTPSPTLVPPDQLTTEQHQPDTQQQNDQQQGQESPQQQANEAEPRLEKLQQQRQQLLRSIGSLQRQQQELQRELEEHRAAAAQQPGWSSTSNSLRWHELQKLQQQQQNKQKRLIECESEIGQWLKWKQKQHQEPQQHPLSQQQQQQSQVEQQNQQQQRGDTQPTEGEIERGVSENQTSSSNPSRQCERQRAQQPIPGNCEEEVHRAAPCCSTAPQGFHPSMCGVSPSVAAAADTINEAAAAALSGRDQTKPEGDSPSWDSVPSSESDGDAAKAQIIFEGCEHTSSQGSPTATTAVPTPPPLRREASASTQQRRSSSEIPPSRTSSRETARTTNKGRVRDYSCASAFRLAGRCGSRASSAGPQIRTGEAARTATAATPAATARRSLTTCIYSTAPRHAVGAAEISKSNKPKRSTAYWEETDSSSKSSTSDSSSCSSSSSDSTSDGDNEATDRGPDMQGTEANIFGRGMFGAAATGAAANIAGAAAPAACGGAAKATLQPRQQQLPSPPPRRVPATQGVRKDGSRSSSADSGRCKTRGASGRRRFVRTRGYLQQQQDASQQQRHEQQKHPEQPQRRQQLWRGTVSGNKASDNTLQTESASATLAGGPSSDATPQVAAAAAAAWLLPPDFPEPFGAEGRPLQKQADNCGPDSGHPHHQQQHRRKPPCDHPGPTGPLHAVAHQQNEGARERTPVDSPALLSQSLEGHHMRQQRLQQELHQEHMLHRELQQHREMQAAAEADRRQLLFPDEDLPTFPANTEATETGRPAVPGQAAATAGQSVPAAQAEGAAAPPDGRWANFEEDPHHLPNKGQSQRNPCWPGPPHCRNFVAEEADSRPAYSTLHRRGEESVIPAEGTSVEGSGTDRGPCVPEVQQPISASGAASAGESCSSSSSNHSVGQTDRRGSTSGRSSSSDSEAEDPANPLRASGQWRPPLFSQQKHRLHQQEQENLYRSLAQDTLTQPTPPVTDAAGPSHWGTTAPQRSSLPPLGCSSGGVNDSATLRRGTGVATATPTRLFPHYDPADVDIQRSAQCVSFCGTHEASRSVPSGAAAAALSEGHSAGAGDALRRLPPSVDAPSAMGGSGSLFRDDSRQVGEVPPALGMWQHLRTRGSLPQTRENVLLHSPSRSHRM